MEKLAMALGPAFAAGFAVQKLLEILDPILAPIVGDAEKKQVLGLVSLGWGLLMALVKDLRVLAAFGVTCPQVFDIAVTGLIISGGTEGFNSIMKFLSYAKEDKKACVLAKGLAPRS